MISCNYEYTDFVTSQKKKAEQRLEIYNKKFICIIFKVVPCGKILERQKLCAYYAGHKQDKYYIQLRERKRSFLGGLSLI